MLNQIIAVAGTIIAALIGFIAIVYNNARSNRHALELEKLRIGAEESKYEARSLLGLGYRVPHPIDM